LRLLQGMSLRDLGVQPGEMQQPELWIYSRGTNSRGTNSHGTSRSNSRDLAGHQRRERRLSTSSSGSLQPEPLVAK
jgi:hypothetical protein